jgi:hypothetical protein
MRTDWQVKVEAKKDGVLSARDISIVLLNPNLRRHPSHAY